jgi:hypothetical protein
VISLPLIDHGEPVRLPTAEAARLAVEQYGPDRVYDIEVAGLQSAFIAYWREVDRIVNRLETDS